jgi:superoxide dismutase, Fe-Mn family
MAFELPALPYANDALEPHIDAKTMEIHHDKHHAAYTSKLNDAIKGTEHEGKSIEEILKNVSKLPGGVRNNGGGYYNHNLFWQILSPNGGGTPSGELAEAINKKFGSFENFKKEFSNAGATQFGSGWAWLCVTQGGEVSVCSTPNQDNPIMDVTECSGTPILGLDVWEHAYYLKYQNKRPEYLGAVWSVINWKKVAEHYQAAK